eukprot:6198232-Pleurochrysis_carterae.AAC.2
MSSGSPLPCSKNRALLYSSPMHVPQPLCTRCARSMRTRCHGKAARSQRGEAVHATNTFHPEAAERARSDLQVEQSQVCVSSKLGEQLDVRVGLVYRLRREAHQKLEPADRCCVPKRHQRKDLLGHAEQREPAELDQLLGEGQRDGVMRADGVAVAAVHVPGELVEQHDQREAATRRRGKAAQLASHRARKDTAETLAHVGVERGLHGRAGLRFERKALATSSKKVQPRADTLK